MVKVTLHGDLGDQIGSEWNLKVNSVSEAIRAIEANTGKLIKYLIQQAQNEAKYEIFINNRSVWVPNIESLPQKNKDLTKKHIDSLRNSELNMPFENDKLSSIDIIPVIEGAGGGGGGGGGCFPAGIKISTPNGNKNIENFKAGDEILCFDKDKNIKTSVVEETFFHEKNKILKITLWGGKTIRATENHWFLNEHNRFAPLSNFKIGDILIHQSGDVLPIERIEEDGYEDVYNMHVKDHHTYIAEEILVHNGGGGKGGKGGGGMMKGIIAIFLAVILAIIPGTQVFAGLTLQMMMPAILGLVAVGVSLMLSKPPPMVSPAAIANPSADFSGSPNGGGGEPSYLFNGPVNTVGEGGPVPVGYGRLIIGSHQVFASYDQYYRIQSRESHLETEGKQVGKPKRDPGGDLSYPSKSYYFNTRGYPVKITNINNEDMSTTSLTS